MGGSSKPETSMRMFRRTLMVDGVGEKASIRQAGLAEEGEGGGQRCSSAWWREELVRAHLTPAAVMARSNASFSAFAIGSFTLHSLRRCWSAMRSVSSLKSFVGGGGVGGRGDLWASFVCCRRCRCRSSMVSRAFKPAWFAGRGG